MLKSITVSLAKACAEKYSRNDIKRKQRDKFVINLTYLESFVYYPSTET